MEWLTYNIYITLLKGNFKQRLNKKTLYIVVITTHKNSDISNAI